MIGDSSQASSSAVVGYGWPALAYGGDIIGGNDSLSGGDGDDILVGDNGSASSTATVFDYGSAGYTETPGAIEGGDDRLEGGRGFDQMWGDNWDGSQDEGGDDIFVFVNGQGGIDIIWDFEGDNAATGDVIEMDGFNATTVNVASFSVATINGQTFGGTLTGQLVSGNGQQIYVVGTTGLGLGDIIFT